MPPVNEAMNDAAKRAIERTIRFIQDYRVESATGYGAWEIWVRVADDEAEERAGEILHGNWAPGLQHALTIRAGDQRGSHCAELWVTGAIYGEARELVRTYIPLGTTMGDDEDGFRIEVSGLLLTRAEAEAALAAADAAAAGTYIGIPPDSGDPLDTVILPIAADYLDRPADATAVEACRRNLPTEHRDTIPESGATWRQLGAALDAIAGRIHRDI